MIMFVFAMRGVSVGKIYQEVKVKRVMMRMMRMTNTVMMINLYFDENSCTINSNLAACDKNNIELWVSMQTSSCTNGIQVIKSIGKVHKKSLQNRKKQTSCHRPVATTPS